MARTVKKINTNTILVGIPDVKTSLGRPSLKWKNIQRTLKKQDNEMDSSGIGRGKRRALVKVVMNLLF